MIYIIEAVGDVAHQLRWKIEDGQHGGKIGAEVLVVHLTNPLVRV